MIHRLMVIRDPQRSRIILHILRGWHTSLSFSHLQPSSWTPISGLFSFRCGVTSLRAHGRTAEKEHVWIIYGQQEDANWQTPRRLCCIEWIAALRLLCPWRQVQGQKGFSPSITNVWLVWDPAVWLGFNSIQFKVCEHKYLIYQYYHLQRQYKIYVNMNKSASAIVLYTYLIKEWFCSLSRLITPVVELNLHSTPGNLSKQSLAKIGSFIGERGADDMFLFWFWWKDSCIMRFLQL